jgi:hypothetical protein
MKKQGSSGGAKRGLSLSRKKRKPDKEATEEEAAQTPGPQQTGPPDDGDSKAMAPPPKPYESPPRKRKLDKELIDKGTQTELTDSHRFSNIQHGGVQNTIKRGKYTLPMPVTNKEVEEDAIYKAKVKKKKDQKEHDEAQDVLDNWNVEEREYDPDADVYEGIPYRSDYLTFAKYNRMTRRERGLGELANSIVLRFFDVNAFKLDYTALFCGKRGSGKTFCATWLLWRLCKHIPRFVCFTRTRVREPNRLAVT